MKIKLKRGGLVNIFGEEKRGEKEHSYEQSLLYKILFARIVNLPEADIVSVEYYTHSGTIAITYGVGKPWEQKKTISRKAPKDFVDFYKPYINASYEDRLGAIKRYHRIKALKKEIGEKKEIYDAYIENRKSITEAAHRIAEKINDAKDELKEIEEKEPSWKSEQ